MSNYLYGAATTAVIVLMVNVIDSNVPNDLWYYINSVLPF